MLLRREPPRAPSPTSGAHPVLPGSMAVILSGALVQTLSPWRLDPQVSFTGCWLGPLGSDPASVDRKLVWAVWLPVSLEPTANLTCWYTSTAGFQRCLRLSPSMSKTITAVSTLLPSCTGQSRYLGQMTAPARRSWAESAPEDPSLH